MAEASYESFPVTVVAGQSLSGVIDRLHYPHIGFIYPAMTSTLFGFDVSDSATGTFVTMRAGDGGAFVCSFAAAGGAVAPLRNVNANNSTDDMAFRFMKIHCNSVEVADRVITVILSR